jgi:hypothetical protein
MNSICLKLIASLTVMCIPPLVLERGYTLHVHTASGEKGYTLHVQTEGSGKGYTLHVHTAGGERGYSLYVKNEKSGKGCTLLVADVILAV